MVNTDSFCVHKDIMRRVVYDEDEDGVVDKVNFSWLHRHILILGN